MGKHPQLAEKLQLLYLLQLNPRIASNADLARELGKSRQAISRWCRGHETSRGNSIPLDALHKLAGIFSIEAEWFSVSLDDFENQVRNKIEGTRDSQSDQAIKVSTSTLPITNVELFGREDELGLLDRLWLDPGVNVVEIVAFGGTGKSSLINKWLSQLSKEGYKGATRIYAWSFYWQSQSADVRSSGDYFIEQALDWFGDPNPKHGTPWSKAIRLANLVRESGTLLILDGLEPLQFPPGEKHGQITNLALSIFVKELASENTGLCVITTRFKVGDMAAYQDGRVAKIDLVRLTVKSAIEMLKNSGLTGSDHQFAKAVEYYSGHALSLSLLAGYMNVVYQGDMRNFVFMNSVLEEKHNRNHVEKIMEEYLAWLEEKADLQLLQLICLFDRTTTLSEIRSIVRQGSLSDITDRIFELKEQELKYAIRVLDDANLISTSIVDFETGLDCHPLVRDFIVTKLKNSNQQLWEKGHALVFKALIEQACKNPVTIEEFEPLFRAVIHGTQATLYEEAFAIYHQQIKRGQILFFTNGSQYAHKACIAGFFDAAWIIRSDKLNEEAQAYLLASAAINQISLGNFNQAMILSKRSIDWFRNKQRWLEASITVAPLVSMLIASGRLSSAMLLLQDVDEIVQNSNNAVIIAGAENFRGYMAYLGGDHRLAKEKFENSEKMLSEYSPDAPAPVPTISAFYCKFLLETGSRQEALEKSLKAFAWRRNKSWQVAADIIPPLAWDMQVLGLTFLEIGDKVNAEKILDEQVNLLRNAEEWLFLPTGLNSRARLNIKLQHYSAALADLRESLEISQQMGVKFGEWEAYLELARLYAQKKDRARGLRYLNLAKDLPDMDQYKFRDREMVQLEQNLAAC